MTPEFAFRYPLIVDPFSSPDSSDPLFDWICLLRTFLATVSLGTPKIKLDRNVGTFLFASSVLLTVATVRRIV